jgi:hypothetical protein
VHGFREALRCGQTQALTDGFAVAAGAGLEAAAKAVHQWKELGALLRRTLVSHNRNRKLQLWPVRPLGHSATQAASVLGKHNQACVPRQLGLGCACGPAGRDAACTMWSRGWAAAFEAHIKHTRQDATLPAALHTVLAAARKHGTKAGTVAGTTACAVKRAVYNPRTCQLVVLKACVNESEQA